MKHALIIGGAGFIGLHLARRLRQDAWRVDILDNFSRGRKDTELDEFAANESVTLIEGSLGDPGVFEKLGSDYSVVFHLAAILGVQNVSERPFDVLEMNTALTVAAIDVARKQSNLARFVFASTSEVYAGTLENFELTIPTPETAPLSLSPLDRPRTSYALSKIYGEALSLHSGLPVTVIRPHNFYGPRMGLSHVIPQLLERCYATPTGGALEVFSPDHRRTFCYISDAVEMIVRLVDAPDAIGCCVNVGTESPEIAIRSLAEIVVETVGKDLAITQGPETPGSPLRRAPDMSLCAKLSGFRSQIPLEEGVARTFEWYQCHVFDPAQPS